MPLRFPKSSEPAAHFAALALFQKRAAFLAWVLAAAILCGSARAGSFEFTRLVAHWADYDHPDYLPFIAEIQPQVVQVGFYGAHFWSLADTPFGGGYPAHLPVRGHRECAAWFAQLNTELHRRGAKVVGHLNVKFLVGDPESAEGPRGFFKFYAAQWDEQTLGPRPPATALELLELDKKGKPISQNNYSIGGMREYWACLNNPHWRQVLKAWVRHAIKLGVDGLIANYFYRHDCHCRHCISAFRAYLRDRFSATELENLFAISDLEGHEFTEIPGWHDPAQTSPLRLESLRFSQIANKRAFDEVFLDYGRSIKPDLLVAQWNHLGNFDQISGDERCLLPAELWAKHEDYLWYSTGGAANYTDLANGILGEGTLQARYLRGASGDKPFTLGKYEATRIRVAIAELAANGGAPMGFYTNFKDPEARREIVRYYRFLRDRQTLFDASGPASELTLLFPRSRVQAGDVAAVARFKQLGQALLDRHLLFDILPDDSPLPAKSARFALDCRDQTLTVSNLAQRLPANLSRFEAPRTVRVSLSRPAAGNEWTLHLVNYNRREPAQAKSPGAGIQDEQPVAAPPIKANLAVAGKSRLEKIELLAPEIPGSKELVFEQSNGRVKFEIPGFLVYGVVRIQFQ